MIYTLTLYGGPRDGEVVTAFRPYFALQHDGQESGCYARVDPFEWTGDETRAGKMHFRPGLTNDDIEMPEEE